MALYKVGNDRKMLKIKPSTFAELGDRERRDMQAMLRDNFNEVFKDQNLFLLAEEYSNWQDSSRSIDLLAIDKNSNVVVIELKRTAGGTHMELQAIRYAAMVSMMTFEDVVTAHESFLAKRQNTEGVQLNAREEILRFLGPSDEQNEISDNPRIVLISPNFSKEITTTVLWLNKNIGMDIKCLEMNPYQIGQEKYIDMEQVIPLPAAEEFTVRMREKIQKADEIKTANKRRARTMAILVERGHLREGDRLYLIKPPRPGLQIPDESAKKATFLVGQTVKWDYNESVSSLSDLCRQICLKYGGEIRSGAFQGPDHWAKEGDAVSLSIKSKEFEA